VVGVRVITHHSIAHLIAPLREERIVDQLDGGTMPSIRMYVIRLP
jgi:hypothetical protein